MSLSSECILAHGNKLHLSWRSEKNFLLKEITENKTETKYVYSNVCLLGQKKQKSGRIQKAHLRANKVIAFKE